MMKRLLSLVLALTMLLSTATVSLSADDTLGTVTGEAVVTPAGDVTEPIPEVTEPDVTEPAAEVTEPVIPEAVEPTVSEDPQPSSVDEYVSLPNESQYDLLPEGNTGEEWGIFRPEIGISLAGNDELFEQYLTKLLYGGNEVMPFASEWGRERLSEEAKKLYDQLKPHILAIAAGAETSSVIQLQKGTVVTSNIMNEFLAAMATDFPSETYWMDPYSKGWGWKPDFETGCHSVIFDVAGGYCTSETQEYLGTTYHTEVDVTKIQKANAALQNARNICANATGSEYDMVKFFASEICRLADYDHAAFEDYINNYDRTDDISPWMLINVFDGDTATSAVCEGFAKSFRYLCELAGIECYCVTGTLDGVGHMWNVVRLDGEMHVLDLTGVDGGYSFEHYMNNVELTSDGYVIGDSTYVYDDLMFDLYSESVLLVAKSTEITTVASGNCGEDGTAITWTLDSEGTLVIYGNGRMIDFSTDYYDTTAWRDINKTDYMNSIKKIIIGDGVTSIGAHAFNNFAALKSVTLPDTLTSIGEGAFEFSVILNTIDIPGSVNQIDARAFMGCESLTSIVIPASVATMGEQVFENCLNLTAINCEAAGKPDGWDQHWVYWNGNLDPDINWNYNGPSAAEIIASGSCGENGGDNLTWTLNAAGTLTISGSGAMDNYTNEWTPPNNIMPWDMHRNDIINVVICEGVTSIGRYAFGRAYSLASVSIPASVTSIGNDTFAYCTSLAEITVDPANTSYRVDGNCLIETGSGKLLVAYNNCSIPNDGSVKSLEMYSFSPLSMETNVVIPASVTKVAQCALTNGYISSVSVDPENTAYYMLNDCLIEKDTKTLIKGFGYSTIPADGSITSIARSAFENAGLRSVVIPDSVTSIGINAFTNSNLVSAVIPASVTDIGETAFRDCYSLADIYCEAEEKPEGWHEAWICHNDTITPNVHWGSKGPSDGIIDSGSCGEKGGDNLTWQFDIEGTLTISGEGGMDEYLIQWDYPQYTAPWFSYRDSILDVVIEEGVTSIGSYAFDSCNNIRSIAIPASVEIIRYNSLYALHGLDEIIVADGNSHYEVSGRCLIEKYTKTLIAALSGSTIPNDGSVEIIELCAYSSLNDYTDVTIPSSVTTIRPEALCYKNVRSACVDSGNANYYDEGNCVIERNTKTLVKGFADSLIPDDILIIERDAFKETDIESIVIPEGVTTIREEAFANCYELKTATIPSSAEYMEMAVFGWCVQLETVICKVSDKPSGWAENWLAWGDEIDPYPTVIWAVDDEGTCGENGGNNLTWKLDGAGILTISGTGAMDNYTAVWNWPEAHCAPWFDYRDTIKNVVIEEGVTSIGSYAFDCCNNLNNITIPASVSTIMQDAIIECHRLASIEVDVNNADYRVENNCLIEKGTASILSAYGNCAIPESGISRITTYAFSSLQDDVDIHIPASVTDISMKAFGFGGIRSITVDEGNPIYYKEGNCLIENYSKTLMKGFADSVIPADGSVTVIGDAAFAWETMETIVIPDTIVRIYDNAFYGCSNLTNIEIPSSVTDIGAGIFVQCNNLKTINCGPLIKPAGWHDNWVCWNSEITPEINWGVGSDPDEIIASGFCGENGGDNLTWKLDGAGILTISGTGAMDNYTAEWEWPEPHCAPWFEYRNNIASVIIDEGVTSIGKYAFDRCYNINSMTIPASVSTIKTDAIIECTGLSSIEVAPDSAYYHIENNCLIENSTASIISAYGKCSIPESGISCIQSNAFSSLSENVDIHIPASVTEIAQSSLSYTSIQSVTVDEENPRYYTEGRCLIERDTKTVIKGYADSVIPSDGSVTVIGACAFRSETMETITIPNTIEVIRYDAFFDCNNLTSITIPFSVTTMESQVFGYSENLKTINCGAVVKPTGWHDNWVCWNGEVNPDIIWSKAGDPGVIVDSGYCGDTSNGGDGTNLTWKLDGAATLTISGEGRMEDYLVQWDYPQHTAPWFDYRDSILNVVIEEGVTSIGSYAFDWSHSIKSVTIPESMESISYYSFARMEVLEDIILAEGNSRYVMSGRCLIEKNTKTLISALSGSTIPNDGSVEIIEEFAYSTLNDYTDVVIPSSVTSIKPYALCYQNVQSVAVDSGNANYYSENNCVIERSTKTLIKGCSDSTIPNDIVAIGPGAFRNTDIESVVIPESVTTIHVEGFAGCNSLKTISIPANVTKMGMIVFNYSNNLETIYIEAAEKPEGWDSNWLSGDPNAHPAIIWGTGSVASGSCGENGDNLTWTLDSDGTLTVSGYGAMENYTINDSPFYQYIDKIKSVVLEQGVTSIGDCAFTCCAGLTSVTIPNSVTSIGNSAFKGCTGLTEVTIPDSVTNIGAAAFYECTGITEITIPESVTSIGNAAFWVCTDLTSIKVDSGNPAYCSIDGVLFSKDKTELVCYPAGKNGSSYSIPEGVTSIGNYAFYYCTALTEVTIPDSVTSIGDAAFSGCTGLTGITIPDSVTSIGEGAFGVCTALTEITIPNSVTSIGGGAFATCTGLTSVTIPNSVTSIGWRAFYNCPGLTEITIPESVTSVAAEAFNECINLTDIYCEADGKPDGWDEGWKNGCSATVHWSHESKYVVTYDANGGTGAPASQTKEKGKVLTLSSVKPTREDYTFLGWATSADASSAHYNPGSSFTIDADTTLYAVWKKNDVTPEGQLVVGSVTARKGKTVEVPVVINGNPGVNAVTVTPVYDKSVMKLVSVKCSDSSFNSQLGINIVILGSENIETDGEFFVMVFEVLENAEDGVYDISLKFREATGVSDGTVVERQLECVSGTVSVKSIVYGDANGDGKITTVDLSLLCMYIANYDYDTETSSVDVQAGADVNADGTINTRDLSMLSLYIANYDYDLNESTIVLGPKN